MGSIYNKHKIPFSMNRGFIRIIRWSHRFIYIMEISPASVYCNSCLMVIDKNITKQHKLLTEAHAATKLQVTYFPQIHPQTSIELHLCVWVFPNLIVCYIYHLCHLHDSFSLHSPAEVPHTICCGVSSCPLLRDKILGMLLKLSLYSRYRGNQEYSILGNWECLSS